MHPANAALRFILEFVALVAFGMWGHSLTTSALRYVLMGAFPLGAAALWGVFAKSGDPSRGGGTVFETPGGIRLVLELVFFLLAAASLLALGHSLPGFALGTGVILHYSLSWRRIVWLLRAPPHSGEEPTGGPRWRRPTQ